MRRLNAADFSGKVTFITGPEKDSGKTTLLNRALGLLREAGESPAFLSVGFGGESRDAFGTARKPRIRVEAGECWLSAERYLAASGALPELLEALPGSTALGRLALARARRASDAVLVGPERNELAGWAIGRIREEGWARTVLIDGAINRITQVSAFPEARFLFSLRADPAGLEKAARKARLVAALAGLPCLGAEAPDSLDAALEAAGLPRPGYALYGPLTAQAAGAVPEAAATVVIEDFTKVFLDDAGLARFARDRALAVRSPFVLTGIVAVLRGLEIGRFRDALGRDFPEGLLIRNPYETEPEHAAA